MLGALAGAWQQHADKLWLDDFDAVDKLCRVQNIKDRELLAV